MIPLTDTTSMRDLVFPLVNTSTDANGVIKYENHVATAFFIGKRGFALTAAHVIGQLTLGSCHALLVDNDTNEFRAFKIGRTEVHPVEDIAIIEIIDCPQQSCFYISSQEAFASRDYFLWGYPSFITEELRNFIENPDEIYERPDLIYSKGHIRRKVTREMHSIFKGSSFIELSEIAGDGCSGGPVVLYPRTGVYKDQVIGIYVGSHHNQGLAVRIDDLASWSPSILGNSIQKESM